MLASLGCSVDDDCGINIVIHDGFTGCEYHLDHLLTKLQSVYSAEPQIRTLQDEGTIKEL